MNRLSLFHLFLDFLYPRYCPICGEKLIANEMGFCPACALLLPTYCEQTIHGCDRLNAVYIGNGLDSLFLYQKSGAVRRLIHDFKYNGNAPLGKLLSRMAVRRFDWNYRDYDLILAVPPDSVRLMKRGYSQTGILARSISRATHIPYSVHIIARRPFSHSQTHLTGLEREGNVAHAFYLKHPEALCGKRILLVDDVLTTGATLTAIGEQIEKAGAHSIRFFTIAVTE